MDFKDFDLSQYYRVLEDFKTTHTDEIVKRFGSMEKYDEMVAEMRSRERGDAAAMAVKLYGSIDNYTKAMEKNLSRFLSQGPEITKSEAANMVKRTESITQRLTADLSRDAGSPEVQKIVWELISYVNDSNRGMDMGENYWSFMAESYRTNPVSSKERIKNTVRGPQNI